MKRFVMILLLMGGIVAAGQNVQAAESEANLDFNFYGAIAYSPSTGRWGISTDQWNIAAAQQNAGFSCGVFDCSTVVWVRNGCAAVSVGLNRGHGWAIGYSRWAAQNAAQINCARLNGACTPLAWVCTSGW